MEKSFFRHISLCLCVFVHFDFQEFNEFNPAHGVSEIHDCEDFWQWSRLDIRLNAFCRSTMPQKQLIVIREAETKETYLYYMLAKMFN